MGGVGNAGGWLWGAGVVAFGVALIGRGWSGQFARIANVWLGEVMSGLICGGLISGGLTCGGAFALEVLRGSGVAAMGFRIGATEGRSWESQAIASRSACCARINGDRERMLFAHLLFESSSPENLPESLGLAIPVPLPTVLARAEECCSGLVPLARP
jgi:hypothetical protein